VILNSGHVKVEYAFETARVRLYLPSKGETWFFIDSTTTVQSFKDQIMKEDALIENFDLLDGKREQIKGSSEDSLYSVISREDSAEIFIKINNHLHLFDSAKAKDLPHHVQDFKWFKKCSSNGLASAHSATISTFINQLEKTMDEQKVESKADLLRTMGDSLKFFDDVVVKEEFYLQNLKRIQLIGEIQKLEGQKS
jgi:hypothetical protein